MVSGHQATLISPEAPCSRVDPDERFAKRVRGAALLRAVPAQRTLEMAFEIIRVTRDINTAAAHAST